MELRNGLTADRFTYYTLAMGRHSTWWIRCTVHLMGAPDSVCALIQCATETSGYYLDPMTTVRIAEAPSLAPGGALRRGRTSGRGFLIIVDNS